MKKYNNFDSHMVLLGIIIPFLVFFISMNTTFAYFTATAAKQQSSSQTASVQITFKNTQGQSSITATTESGSTNIIPGDTLTIGGTITNAGTADAYVLMRYALRIQKKGSNKIDTLKKKYLVFDESGNLVDIEDDKGNIDASKPVSLISATANQNFKTFNAADELEYKFIGEKFDNTYKNAKVEYELNAYAIQTAHITQEEATKMLLENAGYYSSKIFGNSYQDVVYGKNMINKASGMEGYYINSSGVVAVGAGYNCVVTDKIYVKPSTRYTYSGMGNVQGTTVSRTGYQYDENDNPLTEIAGSYGDSISFSTASNVSYVRLQYVKTAEQPMLELGSTATEYEPYIGGPDPSPTTPSQIQSVGELTKNLAEKLFNINSSGSNTTNTTLLEENKKLVNASLIKVNGGQKYTLSRTVQGDYFRYFWYDTKPIFGETKSINGAYLSKTQLKTTITAPNNAQYLFVRWSEGYDAGNVQITENDETAAYEPYGKYKIPVEVTNKNLFNISNVITYGDRLVNNGNGTLSIKRSESSAGVGGNQTLAQLAPNIQVGKTYILSMLTTLHESRSDSIYLATSKYFWESGTARTITQEDLESMVFWYAAEYDATAVSIVSNIQIEEGATATEYVPHVEPFNIYLDEPLRRIGDVADYVDLETGKIVRRVKEIVLNGQESFTTYSNSSEGTTYHIAINDKKIGFNTSLCSHFKNVESAWIASHKNDLEIYTDHNSNNRIYFRAPNASVTTVDQFKDWLAKNPITLVYQLATPSVKYIDAPGINMRNHSIVSIGTTIQPR